MKDLVSLRQSVRLISGSTAPSNIVFATFSFNQVLCFSVSQVEHGVLHLLNPENSDLTVLVDCEGLSPLRIPMQMLRSCSSILQDHFPNRLGCLFIIRLPPVVRVISQTFIQVKTLAER